MTKKLVIAKKIYTMDKPDEFFTAMVIEKNIIKELSNKSLNDFANEIFDEINEFSDNVIIPGFNDSHIHVLGYGKSLESVNLVGCNSKKDFLTRIKEKVDITPAGKWIFGRGWDQERFDSKRYPTKVELDSLTKDHPIMLHRICGHICVVNSSALAICDITEVTKDPEGGFIDRLSNYEPNGILRETAIQLVTDKLPKENSKTKEKWLKIALENLNKVGITSTHANDGDNYDLYKNLDDKLTVRTYLTPFITEIDTLIKRDVKTEKESNYILRWGRIKIYADGSLGGETAAMKEPYENSDNNGMLIYDEKKLYALIKTAHDNGWQLETHAIGDYAAEVVIKAYERSGASSNRAVLTHCQILNKELIKKMAELDIIANIQPVFINTDLHWAERKIGKRRMRYSYAWKTLLNNNIQCAGGSDAPVEEPNPLLGIHAAVNRQDNNGYPKKGWYTNESLSVWEAVKLYTADSAFAEFQEKNKGKLLPGRVADFIVLDKDIFSIPERNLRYLNVLTTFFNGKKVFSK